LPHGFDFEEIFLESRRKLYQDKALPPAFHDFWMKDMAFTQSDAAFLVKSPPNGRQADYLFFPGCQLGGSDPEYVIRSADYLNNLLHGGVAVMLGCCGAPARWAGDEDRQREVTDTLREHWTSLGSPKVIVACPTCKKVLAKSLPKWRPSPCTASSPNTGSFPKMQAAKRSPCSTRAPAGTTRPCRRPSGIS
jgi:Fe-S oxidoreductase